MFVLLQCFDSVIFNTKPNFLSLWNITFFVQYFVKDVVPKGFEHTKSVTHYLWYVYSFSFQIQRFRLDARRGEAGGRKMNVRYVHPTVQQVCGVWCKKVTKKEKCVCTLDTINNQLYELYWYEKLMWFFSDL